MHRGWSKSILTGMPLAKSELEAWQKNLQKNNNPHDYAKALVELESNLMKALNDSSMVLLLSEISPLMHTYHEYINDFNEASKQTKDKKNEMESFMKDLWGIRMKIDSALNMRKDRKEQNERDVLETALEDRFFQKIIQRKDDFDDFFKEQPEGPSLFLEREDNFLHTIKKEYKDFLNTLDPVSFDKMIGLNMDVDLMAENCYEKLKKMNEQEKEEWMSSFYQKMVDKHAEKYLSEKSSDFDRQTKDLLKKELMEEIKKTKKTTISFDPSKDATAIHKKLSRDICEYSATVSEPSTQPEGGSAHRLIGNLQQFPVLKESEKVGSGNVLTIGDLHGNALKLIYLLLRHQLIQMSAENYYALYDIYYTPPDQLTNEQLNKFDAILESTLQSADPLRHGMLRLIGDLFCDRGENDLFTAILLKKLLKKNMVKEIIASNHDEWFVTNLRKGSADISNPQQRSFNQYAFLMTRKDITLDEKFHYRELRKLVEGDYQNHLKLISYEYNEKAKSITFFSHAPTLNLSRINKIANELEIKERIDEAKPDIASVCALIDKINEKFPEIFLSGLDPKKYPESFNLLWGRIKERGKPIPSRIGDVSVKYVHGHDLVTYDKKEEHITCLDDAFGKYDRFNKNEISYYVPLMQPSSALKKDLFPPRSPK